MTWPMQLPLADLAADEVIGTPEYSEKRILPVRMRRLAPEARDSYLADLRDLVVVSDMFRSAESSLLAIETKTGALPPGKSGHGYGRSIDLDILESLKQGDFSRKRDLDAYMASKGWFCHRRDHRMRKEAWHFNHLGVAGGGYLLDSDPYTSWALERLLKEHYGEYWELTVVDVQRALAQLRFYGGAIDGDFGPLSKQACRAFQRAWALLEDGIPGKHTQRTLSYVTAEKVIV